MSPKKFRTNKIIQKVENMADVILRHLQEELGCNHRVDVNEEEALGPTLEAKDQCRICSILPTKERVTT